MIKRLSVIFSSFIVIFSIIAFPLLAMEEEEDSKIKKGYFNNTSDVRLRYLRITPSTQDEKKHPILFLLGKGGAIEDPVYKDFMTKLCEKSQASVYTMDWRCQGKSTSCINNQESVHIDGFEAYVGDLKEFVSFVQNKEQKDKKEFFLDVIALSMGATITCQYHQKQSSNLFERSPFDKIILINPMAGFFSPFPSTLTSLISNSAYYTGFGTTFAPGQSSWSKEKIQNKNKNRAHISMDKINKSITHHENKKTGKDGVTYGWVAAANAAIKSLKPSRINQETLVLISKGDDLVPEENQLEFVKDLQNGTLIYAEGLPHDIFFADDEKLETVIDEFTKFLYRDTQKDSKEKDEEEGEEEEDAKKEGFTLQFYQSSEKDKINTLIQKVKKARHPQKELSEEEKTEKEESQHFGFLLDLATLFLGFKT